MARDTVITLRGMAINDDEILTFAETLKENTSLTTLNLSNNEIGNEGVKAILKMLESNITIEVINLSLAFIDQKNKEAIDQKLKQNAEERAARIGERKSFEEFVDLSGISKDVFGIAGQYLTMTPEERKKEKEEEVKRRSLVDQGGVVSVAAQPSYVPSSSASAPPIIHTDEKKVISKDQQNPEKQRQKIKDEFLDKVKKQDEKEKLKVLSKPPSSIAKPIVTNPKPTQGGREQV